MASISETGHLKNITRFETMIEFVTGYGAPYAPSNENLKLDKLNTKKDDAWAVHNATKDFEIPLITVRGARRMAFEPLPQTATRILATLKASGASDPIVKAAESLNRKLHGKRSTPVEDGKESISVSQLSYDRQADFFLELIKLLESTPEYNPNEPELKIVALNMFYQTLIDANKSVNTVYVPFSNALIARDKVLYESETGMVDTAADVKSYVKALFGHNSPQYAQINGLKFKKVLNP